MGNSMHAASEVTILDEAVTGGTGRMTFYHPAGTFALTPASHVLIDAIIKNKDKLKGVGIDWGSGVGCLTILAAKIAAVEHVIGLEISSENIAASVRNAEANHVAEKVHFMQADSYQPYGAVDRASLEALRGKVDFIVSNPPSSEGDDGFGFRRIVMKGAREYLKNGGLILLNISFQYGAKRVEALHKDIDGFYYHGVAASTQAVPFDLSRPDLLSCLKEYCQEERNDGYAYTFLRDNNIGGGYINAREALENYENTGVSPLTKWQTHLFEYNG